MVILDLEGNVVELTFKPSSDIARYLLYLTPREDVNNIVHTHSPYATTFAGLGRPTPFLSPLLLSFAVQSLVVVLRWSEMQWFSSKEWLKRLANHQLCCWRIGVFAVGQSAEDAVRVVLIVDDCSKTVWPELQIGQPEEIPP